MKIGIVMSHGYSRKFSQRKRKRESAIFGLSETLQSKIFTSVATIVPPPECTGFY